MESNSSSVDSGTTRPSGTPSLAFDHMLRQTRSHHQQLSQAADVKANMLLSVALVLITLSLPLLSRAELRWPLLFLVAACLVATILATLAAKPRYGDGIPVDPGDRRFNPLFFGHFRHLDYEPWVESIRAAESDDRLAHDLQLREIYTLGRFLADTKFRFVTMAYWSLLVGIIGSALIRVGQLLGS